ncbi:MAG: ligase-associated DNA damage response endonuclease PdeM [Phycisphaerales bacterium]
MATDHRENGSNSSTPRGAMVGVAGESITLLPQRAAFWPARRTLLVADLHLGKEETFRSFGIAMPRTVLDETLERLSATARATDAERIVVVGDLVHARRGLTREVVERVAAWRDGFAGAIEYVAGNHDLRAEIPEAWRMRRREPLDAPFAFVHDPADVGDGNTYAWCGHLHPTVRLASSTDRLVMPCFVIGVRRAILPAFTQFARGPGYEPTPDERVFAVAERDVVEIPASALVAVSE